METLTSNNQIARDINSIRPPGAMGGPGVNSLSERFDLSSDLSTEFTDKFVPSSEELGDFNEVIARNRALRNMKASSGKLPQEMTYGDARITYKDGTTTSDYSAKALKHSIEKAQKDSIISVIIRGHGSDKGTTLTGSGGPHGADSIDVTLRPAGKEQAPVQNLTLSGDGIKPTDFAQLLEDKIDKSASGAGIFINSCNVANPLKGDQNLVQVISKKFPGLTVRGVNGTLNESQSRVTGTYIEKPAWGSDFVYYKNGTVVDEPWSHPYTKFPNES